MKTVGPLLAGIFLHVGLLHAGELDVRGWLDRPGTRLLAVEFYATWCEPCMKAVPRWKALHEKYRAQGLRLVVVSTLDPEGQCVNPGWMPDETVCDTEGKIAEAFGLGGKLPAAFVWSWQGNLLVSHGHVDEAERAIEAYLQKSPRLVLDSSIGVPGLRDVVREQLLARGKLVLLAGEAESAELEKVKKRSFEARFDDRLQCELGQELSANSLLKVSLSKEKPARLSLMLFSAESGCLLAAGSAPYLAESARAAVAEAADKLLTRLKSEPQLPGARPDAVAKKKQLDRKKAELWLEYARSLSILEEEQKFRALDQALALDPELAAAHAERADVLWSRNMGTPADCNEGPEKKEACLARLREQKKALDEALGALDRAVALAEGEAEFYAMRVNVREALIEVEEFAVLVELGSSDELGARQQAIREGHNQHIRKDIDRAIALGSIARAHLYNLRSVLNAQAGRKEQAIADATRAIEAKEEELTRPARYYYGQAELHSYYHNRAYRYREAGQEELAKKDHEKARALEEQERRKERERMEREAREFAELEKKSHFVKIATGLEREWRERALGMKIEDFGRLPPAAQQKKSEAITKRLHELARRGKATAEQYFVLSDFGGGDASEAERDQYFAKGLQLLKAQAKGMEQALLFCHQAVFGAQRFFMRERYDQALALLDQVREVAGPYIEPHLAAADGEMLELLRTLMSRGGGDEDGFATMRRLAALDRPQAERLTWLSMEARIADLRGRVFEKLELLGKAKEEYRRLCDKLSLPEACRNLERLR